MSRHAVAQPPMPQGIAGHALNDFVRATIKVDQDSTRMAPGRFRNCNPVPSPVRCFWKLQGKLIGDNNVYVWNPTKPMLIISKFVTKHTKMSHELKRYVAGIVLPTGVIMKCPETCRQNNITTGNRTTTTFQPSFTRRVRREGAASMVRVVILSPIIPVIARWPPAKPTPVEADEDEVPI